MKNFIFLLMVVILGLGFITLWSSCEKDDTGADTGNTAPSAAFTVNPTSGTTTTSFGFDASGCSDNEDSTLFLEVRWDWEGDGSWDTQYSTTKSTAHQYLQDGTYNAKLEVRDSEGLTDDVSHVVTVTSGSTSGQPCPGTPTVTYEGQTYNTVQIGNQCWIQENLNVGAMIHGDSNQKDNSSIEKYCYDNLPANCDTYGGLYQWDEAMAYSETEGARGICPQGWHIPTDDEWKILEGTVDSQYGVGDFEWDKELYRGHDAGGNLKETGTTHWSTPNNGATNSSGFTAIPAGGRSYLGGNFANLGSNTMIWTSTGGGGSNFAVYRGINYHSVKMYRNSWPQTYGYSIRCLKN